MALSCYANWEELEAHLESEISIFSQSHELEQPPHDQLLGFDSDFSFSGSYVNDPFWDSHGFFKPNNCHYSLLPFVPSPPENLYSMLPEIFPAVHGYDEPYPYLKRQKLCEESFNSEIMPSLCSGFVVPNPGLFQESFPGFVHNPPAVLYSSKTVEAPKKSGNGGSLSAQSIAARQRRRKITEKTQELGKLIPGARKMNTAEMFQAAFKYIKFLQAQVGILETMASTLPQGNGDSFYNQEMGRLLGSSLIQEKLYTAEKCLVPKKLVESLVDHHKHQLDIDNQSSSDIKKLL